MKTNRIEEYRAAVREAFEIQLEKVAQVECAADLVPGSLADDLFHVLENVSKASEYISYGWEDKDGEILDLERLKVALAPLFA